MPFKKLCKRQIYFNVPIKEANRFNPKRDSQVIPSGSYKRNSCDTNY